MEIFPDIVEHLNRYITNWEDSYTFLITSILVILFIFLIIQWRTRSLIKTNQELKEREIIARQVAKQKEELTIKNKNITDSLIYAKRIQEALLPSDVTLHNLLKHSFLLYKPKDIVSGDFYWINRKEEKLFLAVVDCTGHGVPGAFMSIIGVELLDNIIKDQNVTEADKILLELNKGITAALSREDAKGRSILDGMDIALCVIDKKKKEMEFSGAFRPIYILHDNKIDEIKGNRFSVGAKVEQMDAFEINKRTIPLMNLDMVYLFTDGYADQFGGQEGKKFKYRRFRHLLLNIHQLPVEEQKAYLQNSIEQWMGDEEQVDDILILGFDPRKTIE